MGILQSGVNQALGMISGAAAGAKTIATMQKGVDTQEEILTQAQKRAKEEQAYQEERTKKAESAARKLTKPLQKNAGTTVTPELAREYVYTAEQLEKHYLGSMDYKKAAKMRDKQVTYGNLINDMEQANSEAEQRTLAEQQQNAQTQERYNQFVNMFTEGGRYR